MGLTLFSIDVHRDDGKRHVVRSDQLLNRNVRAICRARTDIRDGYHKSPCPGPETFHWYAGRRNAVSQNKCFVIKGTANLRLRCERCCVRK
jgi:hypothetical protein